MAAPSYTEDLTDISLMESGETGAAALNISGGGGGAPAFGADFGMQGAGCWDKAASNAERAILTNNAPGAGSVAAGVHIFQWGFVGTPGVLDTLVNRGVYVIGGTASTAYFQYHVDGLDTLGAQGRVGKCYVYVYDSAAAAQLDRVPYRTLTGTPGATPTEFGYGINTTATVKSSNFGQDAHRYGTGAYLTAGELVSAGDGSDDPCTFAGFNVQSDDNTNRWGILTAIGPGSYELQGKFAIGQNNTPTATLCRFRDSDKSITIVDTVHSEADFTEFIFDHASTRVEWNNINITAAGGWNKGDITVTANDPDVFFTGGTLTGLGVSTLQVSTTADGTTWRACGEVTANGATLANSTIIHGAELIDAQDETSYDNSPTTEGAFVGGTGHAATDVLVLDDDTVIVVDAVSGGVVTQFTVDATRSKVFSGVRTQVASDAAGIDFTMTPDTDNFTNSSGLIWDTAADPDGELDGMVFDTLTAAMGHAIEFGTTSPLTMTLRNIAFGTNYSATEDGSVGNETFRFLRTTGTITVNLVGCTGNFGFQKEAGATVNIVSALVQVDLGGYTRGTAVKLIADETLGDVTIGDVLVQGFADASGEVTYSHSDQGTLSTIVRGRNAGIAVAAMAEDGGVFVDETEEASSNATADMTLLPTVPVANDAYNFGHDEQFTRLKLDVSTALAFSGQPTVVWEYWNGAWVALSGVTDGTQGFENAGSNIVSWTLPGDWVARSLTNQANVGDVFYVRARLSVLGTITTVPVGRKCSLDVSRYLPYRRDREIVTAVGLNDVATWTPDTIAKFDPSD